MSASNANRFFTLPSLNLLSRHTVDPTVGNVVSPPRHRDLVNHVPNFLFADAAAFYSRKVLQDTAAARGDCEIESPVNLSTTSHQAAVGQQLGDTLTPAWSPYSYNEPILTAHSAALHGLGVFQRLLALMSRRASALDSIQKRYVQQPLFSRPHSADNADLISLTHCLRTPESVPGSVLNYSVYHL